jgi:hypothetical protein
VLASGQVLIAGGSNAVPAAELYDPKAGVFAATGSLNCLRSNHTASALPSGGVLVVGGGGSSLSALYAEIYDPTLGTFSFTGRTSYPRSYHTATELPSGEVLVTGGSDPVFGFGVLANAERYDPVAGTFSLTTGSMAVARENHTATLLSSGKVLVVGGATAELYDPKTGVFSPTGSPVTPRTAHTASLLSSGLVLVAGGPSLGSAELYDPISGTFSATGSLSLASAGHTASLLSSSKVLVVSWPDAIAELYDPAAKMFSLTAALVYRRNGPTASVLSGDHVLVAGGESFDTVPAEIYGGALGDVCTSSVSCNSGFCVDGRCCDSACTGGCNRCDLAGKVGTCSILPRGSSGSDPACVPPFVCDGTGAACPSSCASDAACADSHYCAPDGTCKPRKALGAACNASADCKAPGCAVCAIGSCVDGVCCDGPCDKGCEACTAALKQTGRDDGVCGPIREGTDPRNACAASGVPCGADGQCNGTGACRVAAPVGVACDVGKTCDGAGSCIEPGHATCDGDHLAKGADGKPQDCSPYKCESGACRTSCESVADCISPNVCDGKGVCSPAPAEPRDGGCSMTTRGDSSPSTFATWLVVSSALVAARRRRKCSR